MVERRQPLRRLVAAIALISATLSGDTARADDLARPDGAVRIASFNASLTRAGAGVLLRDFTKDDDQIAAVAEILRRVRPDIVLVNEIDHDPGGLSGRELIGVLNRDGPGGAGLGYRHLFIDPVNTGHPTGRDLDGDGRTMGPGDAHGWGKFPGQYGMAILSRFPLGPARTFRLTSWAAMPDAEFPRRHDGTPYWPDEIRNSLRLSSKSHWDVVAELPGGQRLHLLASHPTPPVFDGPEDRNGLRNAAEIRFWIDYISGRDWMIDDEGERGPLEEGASFVILGDLNADPEHGDGDRATIRALLTHRRVADPRPGSLGGTAAHRPLGTADWRGNGPGVLRVDYVLPSSELDVIGSGVFWPAPDDPLSDLVARKGRAHASSDHRLVWIDMRPQP